MGRARCSPVDDCHVQTILYKANKEHGTFLQKRYFIMFLQEHAVLFWDRCNYDINERDITLVYLGHTVLFLRLCDLGSKGTPQGCYA